MSDDLHTLHDQANNALVRNLFFRLSDMRSGVSYLSQAVVKPAGNTSVPANAAKETDAPGDSECDQGPIA